MISSFSVIISLSLTDFCLLNFTLSPILSSDLCSDSSTPSDSSSLNYASSA